MSEFSLGPLDLRSCNAFWRGSSVSDAEKLRLLSVVGGVPRYLEEIDPSQSAEQNTRRLCFEPGGFLVREFDQIFHDIFSARAATHRAIVETLAAGPRTTTQVGDTLGRVRGGSLTDALTDLVQAGFLSKDASFDPETGKVRPRSIRYRLSDNYLRFYLKQIAPRREAIEKGLLRSTPLESVVAWDTIMGLQVENLVVASLRQVRHALGLGAVPIINAGPYSQTRTRRREACQVDLLICTRHAVYIVEVKLKKSIGLSVVGEMMEKVRRLKLSRDVSVRTALIYEGTLERSVVEADYFDHLLPLGRLLEGEAP